MCLGIANEFLRMLPNVSCDQCNIQKRKENVERGKNVVVFVVLFYDCIKLYTPNLFLVNGCIHWTGWLCYSGARCIRYARIVNIRWQCDGL